MSNDTVPSGTGLKAGQELSGRRMVIAMLTAGVLSTIAIFLYWEYRTGPFRPLRESIGRTFKKSRPLVEGGRHKGGPPTLRIAMTVPFDPTADQTQAEATLKSVVELARQHTPIQQYDVLKLILVQSNPERRTRELPMEYDLKRNRVTAGVVPAPAVTAQPAPPASAPPPAM